MLDISISDIEKLTHIGEMPQYSDFLRNELETFKGNLLAEGGYYIGQGEATEQAIYVDDKIFKVGRLVATYYANMTQAAIFTCTAGSHISDRASELSKNGQLIESYLVDLLGSVIVEKAMDVLQKQLANEMKEKELHISNRYSPGYYEWSVKEQQQLFTFLPDNFCGITLSESCLMTPTKSVSGIIAIGKNVIFHNHECHLCNSKNCIYRNKKRRDCSM